MKLSRPPILRAEFTERIGYGSFTLDICRARSFPSGASLPDSFSVTWTSNRVSTIYTLDKLCAKLAERARDWSAHRAEFIQALNALPLE